MKGFILLFLFATIIVAVVKSEQEWRVELLEPQGFRVSMKHDEGINSVQIGGHIIYKPLGDEWNAQYEANMTLQDNGWWTYDNLTTPLTPGDRTDFAIAGYRNYDITDINPLDDLIIDEYVIPENAVRVPVSNKVETSPTSTTTE